MRETRFKVVHQGDVEMAHDYGYMVVGDGDAVCFYIDPKGRAYIDASTESVTGCPVVFIGRDGAKISTEIEFSEFPGWRFHAGGAGKSIAISLVRRDADNATPANVPADGLGDLVEYADKLRTLLFGLRDSEPGFTVIGGQANLAREAADRIEPAAAEIARLRAAVATVVQKRERYGWSPEADAAIEAARLALMPNAELSRRPPAQEDDGLINSATRAEFEAWFSDGGQNLRAIERCGDGYKLAQAHHAWLAWNASAKAMRERLRGYFLDALADHGISWPSEIDILYDKCFAAQYVPDEMA